ncbi:uncharacterized protein LOC131997614 isoform X3 [Stomoxys calcitrans]|uniref:uncharacterized protein LOC131995211 isoform X2 n=1 Tax=Stomoxys calcitrans TaxID=35570 RepID=UPI0027E31774|nr:uncharacterized protein LOC131995211 isoform X2 [Stomoxys calcitrans]XP_059224629.1 uncharacterized protein LOC131997614 isoform X3 [Stomoxys calcitrans]
MKRLANRKKNLKKRKPTSWTCELATAASLESMSHAICGLTLWCAQDKRTGSYPKYVITDGVSDLQLRLHKQLIKIGNSTHNRCLYCPLLLIGNWDRDCCLRTVLHGDYIKLCKSLPCRTHRS